MSGAVRSDREPTRTGRAVRGVGRAGKGAALGTGRAVRAVGDLRYPESRWRLVYRLVGLILLAGVLYVGVTFVQVWLASRRDGAREADAAVVLGAAQYNGRPSPVLESRLDHARQLYEEGLVDVIVVTGGKQEGDTFTEGQVGFVYLLGEGVPEADLLIEDQGTNTWESLAAAARILQERDMTEAVMVTDGYHALRVDAIADELGLDASVSPSRSGGTVRELVEETGAVAVGRIVGFRRLVNLDDRLPQSDR